MPRLTARTDRAHLDKSLAHYAKAREGLDDLAVGEAGKPPIHPQYVARTISALASDDAIFTYDVGTPTVWAARYLTMNGRRRMLGSLVHGSMANALPMAIGAQAIDKTRQVISMSGDGGFAMLMGEILSLVQLDLPVKVVIFNNGSLGFVALEMKAGGYLEFGVDLNNPDFAAMARAIGIHGVRVEDPGEVDVGAGGGVRTSWPGGDRRGDEPGRAGVAAEGDAEGGGRLQPMGHQGGIGWAWHGVGGVGADQPRSRACSVRRRCRACRV